MEEHGNHHPALFNPSAAVLGGQGEHPQVLFQPGMAPLRPDTCAAALPHHTRHADVEPEPELLGMRKTCLGKEREGGGAFISRSNLQL